MRPSTPHVSPLGARPLLHNAAFATASASSAMLLLAVLIIAARTLGDEEYGRFSFALALATVFETLMDFGLKEVATRSIAREPARAPRYLQNTFGLKLLFGGGSILCLGLAAVLLRPESDVRWAAVMLGVAAVLRSYMTTMRSVFYGLDRFDLETYVLLSDRILVLCFATAVLTMGCGLFGLAAAFVSARAAAFLLAAVLTARSVAPPIPSFDFAFWRELQLRAIPFGAFVVVLQLYNYVDTIMLGVMRGDRETGLYNAAYRVYEGFAHVPSIISVVLTPRLARQFLSDRVQHRRMAGRGVWIAAVLGLPAAALSIFWAQDLTRLLFGPAYDPAANVLRILAAGFVVMFPLGVLHAVAISTNAERLLLATAVMGCVINGAANLLLIPAYGMIGAACATVIGEAASLTILGVGMLRRARRSGA